MMSHSGKRFKNDNNNNDDSLARRATERKREEKEKEGEGEENRSGKHCILHLFLSSFSFRLPCSPLFIVSIHCFFHEPIEFLCNSFNITGNSRDNQRKFHQKFIGKRFDPCCSNRTNEFVSARHLID